MEMPRRFGGFFRNDADHRDFTAIGTAAGKMPDCSGYEKELRCVVPCGILHRGRFCCLCPHLEEQSSTGVGSINERWRVVSLCNRVR